jgi:hypothetical protein
MYHCFKSLLYIYISIINRVDFLIFRSSKIHAQLASSPTFSLYGAASPPTDIVTPPYHVTFTFHLPNLRFIFWQRFVPSPFLSSWN